MSVCLACRLARTARPAAPIPSTWQATVGATMEARRGAKMWVKAVKRPKKVQPGLAGSLQETVRMLQALQPLRSDVPIDLSIEPALSRSVNLNALKGRIFLPFDVPTDDKQQKVTIAVIVSDDLPEAEVARRLGADFVGGSSLVTRIIEGLVNPTKLLCHPESLRLLTGNPTVAPILGPRGLMPSVRRGTVSTDIGKMIRDARGALDWSADKNGMVRTMIGRSGMRSEEVEKNVYAFVDMVGEQAMGRTTASTAQANQAADDGAFVRRRTLKRGGIKHIVVSGGDGARITIT